MFSQSLRRVYFTQHQLSATQARLAAETALSRTLAHLKKSSSFAQAVEVRFDGSTGSVHFDPQKPYASVNNFAGGASRPLPGSSILVYPNQSHLVSLGECHKVQIVVQLRVSKPPFPYAIFASGSFNSSGGLLLGAARPGADIRTAGPDDLLAAELFANGSTGDSLVLEGDSTIVGNAKTPGRAVAGHNVKFLRGSVVSGARAEEATGLATAEFDPAGHAGAQTLSASSYAVREPMSGLVRSSQSLTFHKGLELKGGLLFVEGDVVIEDGGIQGQGLLVATGKVLIKGGSEFVADSRCAVLAGDELRLLGTGEKNAYFQGLLMSNGAGGVHVSGVTLLGAAVASAPTGARVEVENSRVLFDEQATHVTGEVGFPSGIYPPGGFTTGGGGGTSATYLRLKPVTLPGPPSQTVTNPTPATFAAAGILELKEAQFELVDANGNILSDQSGVGEAFDVALTQIGSMNTAIVAVRADDPLLPGGKFDVDLNRFVKVADRLRIVWRD